MNVSNRTFLLGAAMLCTLASTAAFAAPFHLLKDVYPGTNNGTSSYLVGADSKLIFAGQDGFTSTTYLPWISDGTVSGTILGNTSSTSFDTHQPRFALNGVAYFVYNDGFGGNQLWRSDGTVPGTFALANAANSYAQDFLVLTAYHDLVFFDSKLDGVHSSVNVTDGTVAGTHSISTTFHINFDGQQTPGAVLKDEVLFASLYGFAASDGTTAGTRFFTVPGLASASQLVAVNDVVYFVGRDTSGDSELWKTDGTAAGTSRVKDILPGTSSSSPYQLTRVDDRLFFTASVPANGRELWVSDGTDSGTVLVKDIRAGAFDSNPQQLTALNGVLYFTANDVSNGIELWRSDGTPAGTSLALGDFNPGSPGAFDSGSNTVQAVNHKLALVMVKAGSYYGAVPYVSDGTLVGTQLMDAVQTITVAGSGLVAANGKLFASGTVQPANYGYELIATDAIKTLGNIWCANPEAAIPDDAAAGMNSRFHLPSLGGISQLKVSVDIGHTWLADLSVSLRHEQTGTTVTLFDHPLGCSGDLMDIVFDDTASSSVQTSCGGNARLAYPRDQSFAPANPLAAFNGELLQGDWTLNVADSAFHDAGILHEWCMQFTSDLIFADGLE